MHWQPSQNVLCCTWNCQVTATYDAPFSAGRREPDAFNEMIELVNGRAHLTRQVSHDGQGGHVQSYAGASSELGFVHLAAAAHHIPRATARLHNDCKANVTPYAQCIMSECSEMLFY